VFEDSQGCFCAVVLSHVGSVGERSTSNGNRGVEGRAVNAINDKNHMYGCDEGSFRARELEIPHSGEFVLFR